jgi:CxxH/CxxC protein (TIGR04129 family)
MIEVIDVVECQMVVKLTIGLRSIFFRKVVNRMIYCCEEHVEIGLDAIVDEYQTFPVMTKITGDNLSTSCEYCQNRAIYMVANK